MQLKYLNDNQGDSGFIKKIFFFFFAVVVVVNENVQPHSNLNYVET